MTQYNNIVLGVILLFGLTACGGGDSGDNSTAGGASDNSPTADQTTSMATIKVAPNYDFTTSQQQSINVDLRAITNQRAYVSIYQQWHGDDSTPIPNPDSQLFMQATDSGQLSQTLTVGKQQQSLLMMVMFTDYQLSPITQIFPVDPNNGFQYP
ncbi:hypothetical protein [Photobacterium nomapromontoriensis]|uniref:hypothetical protein n=1 Tax=Photobacterium nomapromontoriensis TaxID=2910237 RepID=UPI003D0AAF4B